MAALPVALGVASILATVASTAVAYKGAQDQKAAAKNMADYNNKVQQNNATAAQQQAAADAALQRDKVRRIGGAQEAAAGKSGASLDSSSDVMFDTSVQGELDALNIQYKGQLAANRYTTQGQLDLLEGDNAARAASNQGAGTLIGGIAKAADQSYSVYNNNPTFSGRPNSVKAYAYDG